jgi:4-amino-4-deoxy-L-arabinose transferase-like glycosyltransferase/putative flippase GtrA
MDADLQHPPNAVARLVMTAIEHDMDVVIGTRYRGSGSPDGLASAGRAASSSMTGWAARLLFPQRLATVSDPMSGLFAFRRSAIALDSLRPNGFKILLEILIHHPHARVAEVAYQFAPRKRGTSKASLSVGFVFLWQLIRLRSAVFLGQMGSPRADSLSRGQTFRGLAFGLIGLSGLGVNTLALWLFHFVLGNGELVAAGLATQVSTSWNFVWIDYLLYRGHKHGRRGGRAIRFLVMNNGLLALRLPVIALLLAMGVGVLIANALTLIILFLGRFLVTDRVIYAARHRPASTRDPVRLLVDPRPEQDQTQEEHIEGNGTPKRSDYLTYRYDVAGVVRIGSQIKLPELEFFRAQWVADDRVDIMIRVGDIGPRWPHSRAALTQHPAIEPASVSATGIRYEEHLGRLGANFRVELGEPIMVEVGPLLARSPHVVYTNVIEALLRFVLVSRGRMLLHSACVELDGVGVMLSALTDTGKTATVLRLLREQGGRFLSDDMTIVDPTGRAVCFPKPLTISAHTLRAVQAKDLTRREWRRLQLQSRLHSKGGRTFGLLLSRLNIPIMSINAITQFLVPPPKYEVDRLVPARLTSTTQVRELFIIERGAPRLAELDHAEALERMITNTDDAYGFPPFRNFAPAIAIDGLGYNALRERERAILSRFLSSVRVRTLASNTYSWSEDIPQLLAEDYVSLRAAEHNDRLPGSGGGHPMVDLTTVDEPWPTWAMATNDPTGEPAQVHGEEVGARPFRSLPATEPERKLTVSISTGTGEAAHSAGAKPGSDSRSGSAPPGSGSTATAVGTVPARPSMPDTSPGSGPPPPPRPSAAVRRRLFGRRVLTFLAVAVPAVVLRLWQLDRVGANSDEAVYAGQAASLAHQIDFLPHFPVFRAHPLLFQSLLSLLYRVTDVTSLTGRLLAVSFGLGTVGLIYLTGKLLYGRRVGFIAALLLAVMPYHVVVSRQVLLDGPMTFFATLALYLLALYVDTRRITWFYASMGALGLAVLSKETAVLLFSAMYAFFAVTTTLRLKIRHLLAGTALLAAVIVVYPLTARLAGAGATSDHFLTWQLLRRANHGWGFYPSILPPALGWPVLLAAVLGLWFLRRHWSWAETLLLSWVIAPTLFFEIWAVKGYQYLLPIAVPMALLAARALVAVESADPRLPDRLRNAPRLLPRLIVLVSVALLAFPTWTTISGRQEQTTFVAGTGGVVGGREAGEWVGRNVPEGAELLALGPSMANIIEFYGHRKTYGLSVSPNPLHRNPVYEPVHNPDLRIRHNDLQYLVWDSYSAARSSFFSAHLLEYARRYNGVVVHTEYIQSRDSGGTPVQVPTIIIYQVRP